MSDYIEMAQGKLGRVIVVRLRPGADVLLSLEEACREHNITNGVILSAIGSLQSPQFCDVVEMPIKAGYGYGETLHLTAAAINILSSIRLATAHTIQTGTTINTVVATFGTQQVRVRP